MKSRLTISRPGNKSITSILRDIIRISKELVCEIDEIILCNFDIFVTVSGKELDIENFSSKVRELIK